MTVAPCGFEGNLWWANREALGWTYSRTRSGVSFAISLRAVARHTDLHGANVLDVGGGTAVLASAMARMGSTVTVIDPDPGMLERAERLLYRAPPEVRERVRLVQGAAPADTGGLGDFDLVCCHSVLMYLSNPWPVVDGLLSLTRPRGLVSVISTNASANAARAALQGRWATAARLLGNEGRAEDPMCLAVYDLPRHDLVNFVARRAGVLLDWYGVGIFSDHLSVEEVSSHLSEIIEVEWLAGCRDPYRQIARAYHCVFRTADPDSHKPTSPELNRP